MVTLTPEKIELTMVDVEGNEGRQQESVDLLLLPLDKATRSVSHRTSAISSKSETPETAIPGASDGHTESNAMTNKPDNATAKAVRQPVLIYRKPFDGTVIARTHWSQNSRFTYDKCSCRNLTNSQVTDDLTCQNLGAPVSAGPVLSSADRLLQTWGFLLYSFKAKITRLLELDEYLHILIAALITYRRRALDILLRASTTIKRAVVKVAIAGLLTAGVMPVALLPATVPLRSPGSVLKAAAERKNNMLAVHQDVILPASPAPAALPPEPVQHHPGTISTKGMSETLREIRQNVRYGKPDHRAEWLINPERTRLHPVL